MYKLDQRRYFAENRREEESNRDRSPFNSDRGSIAYVKAEKDELPKTRVINHPMNRRVMEKSFVSPTKGTEEVRRDYYTDYGGYIPSGQKYNNSGHMRSFHSPSEEISNNNYKDKFQGHVRSF